VALQKLPVVFCLDRAGLVGEDGPTHHGAFDIAYLRSIPNLTICAPLNEVELRHMMYTAQLPDKGPFVIRYPRGRGVMKDWKKPMTEIPVGKGQKLRSGHDIAILSIGHVGNQVMEASEILSTFNIHPAHYDMRFVKPLDTELLHEIFKGFDKIITLEDGIIAGGFGSAVIEFMADQNYQAKVVRLGIPDQFVDHGTVEQLWSELGYDVEGIVKAIKKMVNDG